MTEEFNPKTHKCYKTGKTIFPTHKAASDFLLRIKGFQKMKINGRRFKRRGKQINQTRSYDCLFCNKVHLTSQSLHEYENQDHSGSERIKIIHLTDFKKYLLAS